MSSVNFNTKVSNVDFSIKDRSLKSFFLSFSLEIEHIEAKQKSIPMAFLLAILAAYAITVTSEGIILVSAAHCHTHGHSATANSGVS